MPETLHLLIAAAQRSDAHLRVQVPGAKLDDIQFTTHAQENGSVKVENGKVLVNPNALLIASSISFT